MRHITRCNLPFNRRQSAEVEWTDDEGRFARNFVFVPNGFPAIGGSSSLSSLALPCSAEREQMLHFPQYNSNNGMDACVSIVEWT